MHVSFFNGGVFADVLVSGVSVVCANIVTLPLGARACRAQAPFHLRVSVNEAIHAHLALVTSVAVSNID